MEVWWLLHKDIKMEKEKIVKNIPWGALIFVGFLIIVFGIVILADPNNIKKEVSCYDRFNNEILDMICIEENDDGEGLIFMGLLFILMGVFLFILLDNKFEERV